MLRPLVLLPLMFLLSPHRHAQNRVAHHRLGLWTLETRQDLFTGAQTCRLSTPMMTYERGAVVVRLGRSVDTAQAVYRVDAGYPVETRSEVMNMAHAGFAIDRDDLANPSGGQVRIPGRRLMAAHSVWIQSGPQGVVLNVRTEGLAKALEAARAAGCPDDAFLPAAGE
jgi:hypothetical protein